MLKPQSRLLLLAFAAAISATPVLRDMVVLERINAPPSGFVARSGAPTETALDLRIGLRQSNITGLEQTLYTISTPGSSQYGQFLSQNELTEYVKPSEESVSAVTEWLSSNGLSWKSVSFAGDWISISTTVSKANELLEANFTVFTDLTGNEFTRTLSYSIPSSLTDHIILFHPTVNFPVGGTLQPKSGAASPLAVPASSSYAGELPSSCQSAITPDCLEILYNIPKTPAKQRNNKFFVSEFEGQWAAPSDLALFLKTYRPDINPDTTFAVVSLDGGYNDDNPHDAGAEATLDLQYAVGLATNVPITFLAVGPTNLTDDAEFIDAVLNEANFLATLDSPPTVLSTSYGANEPEISFAMANSICNIYMQLGTRGVSILFASGDGGVAGLHGSPCTGEPFIPNFPATCPYITSVGGTQLGQGNSTEEGVYFSSGGFSNYFSQPLYQADAVDTYKKRLGSTYAGLYNSTGRGFPDVSANGLNYSVANLNVTNIPLSGTSASTPTFASVIALLNDALISAGKPPLGFLNPFLYSRGASALNDITSGNNPGCNTTGFNATVGWDPITGLGTPNYPALLRAVGL